MFLVISRRRVKDGFTVVHLARAPSLRPTELLGVRCWQRVGLIELTLQVASDPHFVAVGNLDRIRV
jgi:hypothetical protein